MQKGKENWEYDHQIGKEWKENLASIVMDMNKDHYW